MNATALVALLALSLPETGGLASFPPGGDVHVGIVVGPVPVRVRVAATEDARFKGLTGVDHIEPDRGMLFVYPRARPMRFWMAGCLIPLDIAYLDTDLRVLSVKTCQPPRPGASDSEIDRAPSPGPVMYVLEMAAGFFDRHGLGVGTRVLLPPSILHTRAE